MRIVLDPDDRPVGKGNLCGQAHGFNLQAATAPLRLIALIKTEDIAKKILTAMRLPTHIPELHPARPPPGQPRHGDDWVN